MIQAKSGQLRASFHKNLSSSHEALEDYYKATIGARLSRMHKDIQPFGDKVCLIK